MRTKTLLVAAAALAAAITSSQAQTVYSQNIVGYVNQVLPNNPDFTLVANPLQGATNNAENVVTCVQPGDSVYVWTGTAFTVSVYEPGFNTPSTIWVDGNSFGDVPSPKLAPGQGFFFQNGQSAPETNTFTGSCILSNTIALPNNPNFSLVASTAPIAGDIDSTNFNLPVQAGDSVYIWNGLAFTVSIYEPGFNTPSTVWVDGNTFGDVPNPQLTVGQGFFYQNGQGAPESWQQNVNYILNP